MRDGRQEFILRPVGAEIPTLHEGHIDLARNIVSLWREGGKLMKTYIKKADVVSVFSPSNLGKALIRTTFF